MPGITSPGHKLGQLIGNFLEDYFSEVLTQVAEKNDFYCDKKGLRHKVRGNKRKVSWIDSGGNWHDLDFVFEKHGKFDKQGEPIAFIELAWRRYTKHSRNKAGEIEGALVHLGNTYRNTCNFLGAILGGEFTEGAQNQLASHDIKILYLPYLKIVESFLVKGINLDYPEDAPNSLKERLINAWESLSSDDIHTIEEKFAELIRPEYLKFVKSLETALLRKLEKICILPLFGNEREFTSIENAIQSIKEFSIDSTEKKKFFKFEIYLKFSNGDRIEASFHEQKEAISFLNIYK